MRNKKSGRVILRYFAPAVRTFPNHFLLLASTIFLKSWKPGLVGCFSLEIAMNTSTKIAVITAKTVIIIHLVYSHDTTVNV